MVRFIGSGRTNGNGHSDPDVGRWMACPPHGGGYSISN